MSREPVGLRDALDLTEGAMLLVDGKELQGLAEVRIHGLPEGYVGRRLRGDCVLVGVRHRLGCMALRLNSCTLKPRLAELLADARPYTPNEVDND